MTARRRTAVALVAAAALALAGQAADARKRPTPRPGVGTANPSALVAMEIAFDRMAAEKGQWTAFDAFAAKNAVMFVPQPVDAKAWLKGRTNPAQSVRLQPYQVWMSCDGTLGMTKGAWQRPDGSTGYFTTAWRQRDKSNRQGDYLWEMDQGDALAAPLPKSDFLEASVADCSRAPGVTLAAPAAGVERRSGVSDDRTLEWSVDVRPDGARRLELRRWNGKDYEVVLTSDVAAETGERG